jgi:hypothetical protein
MQNVMKMALSQTALFYQFHKKNHTCKHYHVSCTNCIVEGIVEGLILKDVLSECDNHLENTHAPLTPTL